MTKLQKIVSTLLGTKMFEKQRIPFNNKNAVISKRYDAPQTTSTNRSIIPITKPAIVNIESEEIEIESFEEIENNDNAE